MLRYCTNCKKDYDFPPLAVSGKENIICPDCGRVIDKNSRRLVDRSDSEKIETGIGNAFAAILHIAYLFYIFFAIIGIAGYILKIDSMLYAATVVVVLAYVIQLFTGTVVFESGVIFIPLGVIAGALIFKSVNGALLGVHVVFLIRHICRDILFALVVKLIELSK